MPNILKSIAIASVLVLGACSNDVENPALQYQAAVNAFQAGDFENATELLTPLAKEQNAQAQFMLADIYMTGKLGAADNETGMKWLSQSAENSHIRAMSMMGVRYLNGNGVDKDLDKAVKMLRTAAENKNVKAQLLMGFLHFHGQGVEKSPDIASRYYYAAALNGDPEAAQRLKKLAEQGGAEPVTYMGLLYKDGIGVEVHAPKAAEMVLNGAEQNFGLAQYMISHAFGAGQGFEQDYLKAHMWANLAAANGHEGAEKRRDVWAQLMTPEQIATAQKMARDWTEEFEGRSE